ncbi:hypothetical protein AAFN85_20160 [Mucilaginibacter sp. CAU 1740]|uniref:hypothetical protein n=1 Tax=Mucilaginibacter sp. CAU 1740 TaxID=3140365 RepID=UPI00325B48EA
MTETFDTYTRRTLTYKIMQVPLVLMVIACVMAPFNKSLSEPLIMLMASCFILGFIGFFVSLFWLSAPSYIKDGELLFEDDKVVLNSITFLLTDLKKIEIDCHNYAGKPGRSKNDGTYNKIIITKPEGEVIEHRFVISSERKWRKLELLMKQWKQDGFKIISNGIDLVG